MSTHTSTQMSTQMSTQISAHSPGGTPHPQSSVRWDIAIEKTLGRGEHCFRLDVAFRSNASRLVLFGPSGAGKSVTLMAIAGLLHPDAGHVRVEGRTLYDQVTRTFIAPRDRALGYLFQDYALFPHLTVRQNVAFGLASGVRNPSKRFEHPQLREWLKTLELEPLADRFPEQLSGGQRQRTALARALVNRPRALLLDEPFSALDGPLRRRLRHELFDLQKRLAIPTILITHDEADVEWFAEEVIHIEAGRVIGDRCLPARDSSQSQPASIDEAMA